ncbi:RNA polymerase sigma factor [Runella sp.]|uniref:RNA polymerase sigma factor n=1 Tax=Runella sp. TaxID=1960881 RepID=UPI003D106152
MKSRLPISEEDLIRGLHARDERTFALLYDHYSPALLGIILKIVKDEKESENLLQDSFVKIWKNYHQYDAAKGRLFTWLLNIARNTALNFIRSAHLLAQVEIQHIENPVYTDNIKIELTHINYIGVSEIVQLLDPKLRQVIDLIYYLGYTQQEVSQKLNLPLGTVKTRTRTALKQLKSRLGQHYY